MTNDNSIQYTRFVSQLLEQHTAAEVEQMTGVNRAYLYDIKKGDFTTKVKKTHLDKIDAAMEVHKASNTEGWKIAPTKNLGIAGTALTQAQNDKLCLALTGATGFGKTAACRSFRHRNSDVVYVHCNTEMTKVGFLEAIASDLSLAHQHRGKTVESRIKAIIKELRKFKNPLLIIDDAGKLRDSAFRMFQILFDDGNGKIGFLLTGVPEFRQKVFKLADKGVFCYKEIARRIGWIELKAIFEGDVLIICHKNGITDPEAIAYLSQNVGDYDTLRRMITAALSAAKKQGLTEVSRHFLAHLNKDITNYRVSKVERQ
jgi:DNA transposition AAA+ family ATPase